MSDQITLQNTSELEFEKNGGRLPSGPTNEPEASNSRGKIATAAATLKTVSVVPSARTAFSKSGTNNINQ